MGYALDSLEILAATFDPAAGFLDGAHIEALLEPVSVAARARAWSRRDTPTYACDSGHAQDTGRQKAKGVSDLHR